MGALEPLLKQRTFVIYTYSGSFLPFCLFTVLCNISGTVALYIRYGEIAQGNAARLSSRGSDEHGQTSRSRRAPHASLRSAQAVYIAYLSLKVTADTRITTMLVYPTAFYENCSVLLQVH
jgi:hypothetical protein